MKSSKKSDPAERIFKFLREHTNTARHYVEQWKEGFENIQINEGGGWPETVNFLVQAFRLQMFPEDMANYMSFLLEKKIIETNGLPNLFEPLRTIVEICSQQNFNFDRENVWILFWRFVKFSFAFYSYFLPEENFYINEIRENLKQQSVEEPNIENHLILYRFPLYCQPTKLFEALCFCLHHLCSIPEHINLNAFEGSMEVGLFLSLIFYVKRTKINLDVDQLSFQKLSCIWNDFIIRFVDTAKVYFEGGFTYPCRLFSFFLISSLPLCKLNPNFLRPAMVLLETFKDPSDPFDFNLTEEDDLILKELFNRNPFEDYSILTMNLRLIEPNICQKIDESVEYFGLYIASMLIAMDPGKLLSTFTFENDHYGKVDRRFFSLCGFYNSMLALLSKTDFKALNPIKQEISKIIEKESFLYLGRTSFLTMLLLKGSKEEELEKDPKLFYLLTKNSFSEFNTSDEIETSYLLKFGYFYWKSSSSDNSLRTQSYLWQAVEKALITRFMEITDTHIVYTIGYGYYQPHLKKGFVRDFNYSLPLYGYENFLGSEIGIEAVKSFFRARIRDPPEGSDPEIGIFFEKDLSDEESIQKLTSEDLKQPIQIIINNLELLLIFSFISSVIGKNDDINSQLIVDCFKEIKMEGKGQNLLDLKINLDKKIISFLALVLIKGTRIDLLEEDPFLAVNNFLLGFCSTFWSDLGFSLNVMVPVFKPFLRLRSYLSSLDLGIIYDMNWGFFFKCLRNYLNQPKIKNPKTLLKKENEEENKEEEEKEDEEEQFPEQPFTNSLHPISAFLEKRDHLFNYFLTKKRSLNEETVYVIHEVANFMKPEIIEKGIFPLLSTEQEVKAIEEEFENVNYIDLEKYNPFVLQVYESINKMGSYIRNLTGLRNSFWFLVSSCLYFNMKLFRKELKEGFGLRAEKGFFVEDQIFSEIDFLFQALEPMATGSSFPFVFAGLKDFYFYLRECKDKLFAANNIPFEIRSFFVVSIYFQLTLVMNYLDLMIGTPNIFDHFETILLHPSQEGENVQNTGIKKAIILACCNINFFPSFASIQSHSENICSIFDVLLLVYNSELIDKQESRGIKSQVFLAYLMYNFFNENEFLHFRALDSLQQVLFGVWIPNLIHDLLGDFETINSFIGNGEDTDGSSFKKKKELEKNFYPFLGYLSKPEISGDCQTNPNVWATSYKIILEYGVRDFLQILLMPFDLLAALDIPDDQNRQMIRSALRSMFKEGITQRMVQTYDLKGGDPWEFFQSGYLRRMGIDLLEKEKEEENK